MKNKLLMSGIIGFLSLATVFTASLLFQGPGTTINGIDVGYKTNAQAVTLLTNQLADTDILVNDIRYKATDLGIQYNRQSLYEALSSSAFLNIPGWGANHKPVLEVNRERLNATLKETQPEYRASVDATIKHNSAGFWFTVPSINGTTVKTSTLIKQVQESLTAKKVISVPLETTAPKNSTSKADPLTNKLNVIANTATVTNETTGQVTPIPLNTYNSFITIGKDLKISANQANIKTWAESLPAISNRPIINGVRVTGEGGTILHTVTAAQDGYELKDITPIIAQVETSIPTLDDPAYSFTVNVLPSTTTDLYRRAEINLATKKITLFENEVNKGEYTIRWGEPLPVPEPPKPTPTPTPQPGDPTLPPVLPEPVEPPFVATPPTPGKYTITRMSLEQNIGCTPARVYCNNDAVRVITLSGNGQALYGTSRTFNNPELDPVNYGYISMSKTDAKTVYEFLFEGSPITIK